MSQQYPQQAPFQPHSPMPASQPAKPNNALRIILAIVGGLVLFFAGVLVGSAGGAGSSKDAAPVSVATTSKPAPTVAETTTPPAPTEPTYATPRKTDFQLTAKILGKECFGSAGCNLSYRVMVAYNGAGLDPAVTYEVVYEVRGGEDGAVTNTLKVTGDQSSVDEEEAVSTKSKASKLTVVVTDVLGN